MVVFKMSYDVQGHFNGFFLDGFNSSIPERYINVDKELHDYLLDTFTLFKVDISKLGLYTEEFLFTIENIDLFDKYAIEQPDTPKEPTLQERIEVLESENVELLKSNFDLDFRVFEIECIIEDSIPATINLRSKVSKQYEQARKLILLGEYERADMEYKLGRYRDRGVITVEQYDELITLMDADEMTGK